MKTVYRNEKLSEQKRSDTRNKTSRPEVDPTDLVFRAMHAVAPGREAIRGYEVFKERDRCALRFHTVNPSEAA